MTGNVINRRNARFLHIYIHTSISSPMNLSTWQTLPINSISISSRERERETHPPRGKHLSLPSSSSVPSFPRKEFTRSCRISPDSAEGRKELLTRPREPVKLPWSVAETRPNGMPRSPIPVCRWKYGIAAFPPLPSTRLTLSRRVISFSKRNSPLEFF